MSRSIGALARLMLMLGLAVPLPAQVLVDVADPGPDPAWTPALAGPPEGAIAAVNRWTVSGGSVARSGATLTAPLTPPVEVAWTFEPGGEIEGEPLVWDDRVLLVSRVSDDERDVHLLTLHDGRPATTRQRFRSPVPLEPSLWQDVVVLRAREDAIEAYRLGSRRLTRRWTFSPREAVGPPLIFGEEVYVVTSQGLERRTASRGGLVWRTPGRFRGAVSLHDQHVWTLGYDELGQVHIQRFLRATGAPDGRWFSGHHGGALPEPTSGQSVSVLPAGVFARYDLPLGKVEGRDAHIVGLDPVGGDDTTLITLGGSTRLLQQPAVWRDQWLGPLTTDEGRWLCQSRDAQDGTLLFLAGPERHAAFARDLPTTVSGRPDFEVGYVGARAFEISTQRMLWDAGLEVTSRAVPARRTLLVVEDGRRLVALRSEAADDSEAVSLGGSSGRRARDGALVRGDGSVVRGAFAIEDDGSVRLGLGRHAEVFVAADVLLLVDDSRSVRLAAGEDALRRGVRALVELDLAGGWAELADQAWRTRDAELTAEILREASRRGADEEALERSRRELEKLREYPSRVRAREAARVSASRAELLRATAERWWEYVDALPGDAPWSWRAALLEEVLAQDPALPAAAAFVRGLLPPDVKPREPFDALGWLVFAEEARRRPLRWLEPKAAGEVSTVAEAALLAAQLSWRTDLVAIESEHLVIITPARRPGVLTRCLALGELTCRALTELLEPEGTVDAVAAREPLVLHLFESREEYLTESAGDARHGGAGDLSWTAGHYDLVDGLSRVWLPEADEDLPRVAGTVIHELTHHWVHKQSSLSAKRRATNQDDARPGYWVVEGLASMVEQFRFDPRGNRWWPDGEPSANLDVVANAGASQLLPWGEVFRIDHGRMADLGRRPTESVPTQVFLGQRRMLDGRGFFYAQSAAACRWLLQAEGGRHAEALRRALAGWYGGGPEVDLPELLGIPADDLGERIRAFAIGGMGPP